MTTTRTDTITVMPRQKLQILPTIFLEYQIMILSQTKKDDVAIFKFFCDFFQKGFLEEIWCESDWLVWYAFLYDILDNPIFMLPDENTDFLEILDAMFITNPSVAWLPFDLRYQAFLNIFEKIPLRTAMTVLMNWLETQKPPGTNTITIMDEHQIKLMKLIIHKLETIIQQESEPFFQDIVHCVDTHISGITCKRMSIHPMTMHWKSAIIDKKP